MTLSYAKPPNFEQQQQEDIVIALGLGTNKLSNATHWGHKDSTDKIP